MEAFKSLEEFGNNSLENHKQLHDLILDNYNILKKSMWGITKTQYNRAIKKGEEVRSIVDVLVEKYKVVSDWNRAEKIKNYFELSNDASDDLLFPPELVQKLKTKEVQSI